MRARLSLYQYTIVVGKQSHTCPLPTTAKAARDTPTPAGSCSPAERRVAEPLRPLPTALAVGTLRRTRAMDQVPAKLGMRAGNTPESAAPKASEHTKYEVLIIQLHHVSCSRFIHCLIMQ